MKIISDNQGLAVRPLLFPTDATAKTQDRPRETVFGRNFEFEHLFSCEIEPFKQAYIERNFRHPIFFRALQEINRNGLRCGIGLSPSHVSVLLDSYTVLYLRHEFCRTSLLH
jgi:hypothetical protein